MTLSLEGYKQVTEELFKLMQDNKGNEVEIIYSDERYIQTWGKLEKDPHNGAYDLRACLYDELTLYPNESKLISSGIKIHINNPEIAALVIPRSGLGAKSGVVVGNLVGLIDSSYQGIIHISSWNRTDESRIIKPGDRIAQLLFVRLPLISFKEVEEFSNESNRGENGLGSSGVV